MRQGLTHTQRTQTGLGTRVDPKVVLSSQILQFSQHELEQAIEVELADNPALERLQDDTEPMTEEAILRVVAPQELKPRSDDFEFRRSIPNDGDVADWTDFAASLPSLQDHLRAQLLQHLSPDLVPIGEFVLGCLDDNGYLTSPVEEIALITDSDLADVDKVLRVLRDCEPAGVGATDVKDCLLLQLRDADSLEKRLARAILKSHIDDLVARRTSRIMRKYRVLPEVVEGAFDEILALTPHPGEAFSQSASNPNAHHKASVTPDLVLTLTEQGWEVDALGPDPVSFGIHRSYRERYEKQGDSRLVSEDERKHVAEYVNRANNFIQSLLQRKRTLRRIGEYLIQHQTGFITTGRYEFLRHLTRTRLAKALEVHESTVSRATAGKFVQIANGEVISFDIFFKPALRVQKMIQEILMNENPSNPLSDEAIAQILKSKGVEVARRTVNKYRDKGRLLSSRRRRSA